MVEGRHLPTPKKNKPFYSCLTDLTQNIKSSSVAQIPPPTPLKLGQVDFHHPDSEQPSEEIHYTVIYIGYISSFVSCLHRRLIVCSPQRPHIVCRLHRLRVYCLLFYVHSNSWLTSCWSAELLLPHCVNTVWPSQRWGRLLKKVIPCYIKNVGVVLMELSFPFPQLSGGWVYISTQAKRFPLNLPLVLEVGLDRHTDIVV